MSGEFQKVVPSVKEAMIQTGLFLLADGAQTVSHYQNSWQYGVNTVDADGKQITGGKGASSVLPATQAAASWHVKNHPFLSAALAWRIYSKGLGIKPWKLFD